MRNTMEEWLTRSVGTLEAMERQLREREAAIERAVVEIRRNTQAIEQLEHNISVIRRAVEDAAIEEDEVDTGIQPPSAPPQPPSSFRQPPAAAQTPPRPRLVAPA